MEAYPEKRTVHRIMRFAPLPYSCIHCLEWENINAQSDFRVLGIVYKMIHFIIDTSLIYEDVISDDKSVSFQIAPISNHRIDIVLITWLSGISWCSIHYLKEDRESRWYRSLPETKLFGSLQRSIFFQIIQKVCNASAWIMLANFHTYLIYAVFKSNFDFLKVHKKTERS